MKTEFFREFVHPTQLTPTIVGAHQALSRVIADSNRVAPGCVAGGALRDHFSKKKITDIDFFLFDTKNKVADFFLKNNLGNTLYGNKRFGSFKFLDYTLKNSVQYDYIIPKINDEPKTTESILEDFDIGLCQIAYEIHTRQLVYTNHYIKDRDEKLITVFNKEEALKTPKPSIIGSISTRKSSHLNRVRNKYPDHEIIFNGSGYENIFI